MKKVFICLLSFTFINLLYGYTDKHSMPASKSVLCETDNIEILRQVVDPAKDEYDIDVVALWLRDKNTGKETKLLQTTRPDWRYWHMSDSKNFYPVSYDSLFVASRAYIYNSDPLQIIVEGSPDFRNEFSYFIDIANKKPGKFRRMVDIWVVPKKDIWSSGLTDMFPIRTLQEGTHFCKFLMKTGHWSIASI